MTAPGTSSALRGRPRGDRLQSGHLVSPLRLDHGGGRTTLRAHTGWLASRSLSLSRHGKSSPAPDPAQPRHGGHAAHLRPASGLLLGALPRGPGLRHLAGRSARALDELFWLGMEMSGQAAYAAAIAGCAKRIRGAVTCGSPVLTPKTAQVPGVTAAPKARFRGRVPFRSGSRLAGPVLACGGSSQLESSFRARNTDPVVAARYFRNGIPDEATELVDQFTDWIENGVMRSRDRSIVYSERLDEVQLPLLVLAAAHDLQRPAEAVRAAFEDFGSTDKTFLQCGREQGFSVDFGHDDLLAGKASPAEIFPRISEWLLARSAS